MNTVITTLLLAIAPSIVLMSILVIRSRNRKAILMAFIAGYFAPIPALVIELLVPGSDGMNSVFRSFFVVALAEEGIKLALIATIIVRIANDRQTFQGFHAATAAALGFAALENVLYIDNTVATLLLRGSTALPIHVSTAIIMTSIIMLYRRSGSRYLTALIIGVIIHGMYDAFLGFHAPISFLALGIVAISLAIALRIAFRAQSYSSRG
jgi:protease PrsW